MLKIQEDMIYRGGFFNIENPEGSISKYKIMNIQNSFLSYEKSIILKEETLIILLDNKEDFSKIKQIRFNGVLFNKVFRNLFENDDFIYKFTVDKIFEANGQLIMFLKIVEAEFHKDYDKHMSKELIHYLMYKKGKK
ncbi:hypothetical protein C518_2409 [Lysinibacillus fusiformis ZB2]|nr:hypothetical protein C518_2409 [Lysinibacillus fusiformis ZB2]